VRFPPKNFLSFVSLSSHWPRPPPCAPWPKFDSDFHSENGPWYFVGRSRRPALLPACDFGPSGTKSLLVPTWGLKLNPLCIDIDKPHLAVLHCTCPTCHVPGVGPRHARLQVMVAHRTTTTLISSLDTASIYHININTPFIQMHGPVPTGPTWARPSAQGFNIIKVIMSHRMCRDRRQFLQRSPYDAAQ
jgi:hypothetical protein